MRGQLLAIASANLLRHGGVPIPFLLPSLVKLPRHGLNMLSSARAQRPSRHTREPGIPPLCDGLRDVNSAWRGRG